MPNSSLRLNPLNGYYSLCVCLAVKDRTIKEHSKKSLLDNGMVDYTFQEGDKIGSTD
jgi:hypothetical protein